MPCGGAEGTGPAPAAAAAAAAAIAAISGEAAKCSPPSAPIPPNLPGARMLSTEKVMGLGSDSIEGVRFNFGLGQA